jgi:hypothetical protein
LGAITPRSNNYYRIFAVKNLMWFSCVSRMKQKGSFGSLFYCI